MLGIFCENGLTWMSYVLNDVAAVLLQMMVACPNALVTDSRPNDAHMPQICYLYPIPKITHNSFCEKLILYLHLSKFRETWA